MKAVHQQLGLSITSAYLSRVLYIFSEFGESKELLATMESIFGFCMHNLQSQNVIAIFRMSQIFDNFISIELFKNSEFREGRTSTTDLHPILFFKSHK